MGVHAEAIEKTSTAQELEPLGRGGTAKKLPQCMGTILIARRRCSQRTSFLAGGVDGGAEWADVYVKHLAGHLACLIKCFDINLFD